MSAGPASLPARAECVVYEHTVHTQTDTPLHTHTHTSWTWAAPSPAEPTPATRQWALAMHRGSPGLSALGGTAGDPRQMPRAPTHGAGQVGHMHSADVQEATGGRSPLTERVALRNQQVGDPLPRGPGTPTGPPSDSTVCCEGARPRSLPPTLSGAHLGCLRSPWSWSARPSAPQPAQGQKCGYFLKANTGRGRPRAHGTKAPGVPAPAKGGRRTHTRTPVSAHTQHTPSPGPEASAAPADCRGTEGPQ